MKEGMFLYHDRKEHRYFYLSGRTEELESFQYNSDILVDANHIVIHYGELLMHLVSLNIDAFKPAIKHLQMALEEVRLMREDIDFTTPKETFYAMYALHDYLYHSLIPTYPFEMIEDKSIKLEYVELIIDIFQIEMYNKLYKSYISDSDDITQLLPRILTDAALRSELKDFLCNPTTNNSFFAKYVNSVPITTKYYIEDGVTEEIIQITTFDEAIALEIMNLYTHQNISKYTKCDICGCLFRQPGGRPTNICAYLPKSHLSCKAVAGPDSYLKKTRNNLKSFISSNNLSTISKGIYQQFDDEVKKALIICKTQAAFEHKVKEIYSNIKKGRPNYLKNNRDSSPQNAQT